MKFERVNQPLDIEKRTFPGNLLNALQNGVVKLEFIKTDGKKRVMSATLNHLYMPKNVVSVDPQAVVKNKPIHVWDIALGEWRSVIPNTVKKATIEAA